MKTTKKILAVLMTAAVVLSMAMTALATAGTPATGSLTVTGAELTGKTVDAYQLFTASWVDSAETGNADDNIDANDTISYVLNSAWDGYFSTVPAIAADTSSKTLSEKAASYIAGLDADGMVALAKALKAYAKTNSIAPTYTSAAATSNTASITGMTPGYYLVIPQGGSTSATRETDATILNVPSNDSANWTIKSAYPTVSKTADGNEVNTANIGDVIDFALTSAVPDMTEYSTYTFAFHDTLSEGLDYKYTTTYGDGVHVYLDTATVDATKEVASNKYTVAFNPSTRKLDITFNDMKTDFAADEGKSILVTYQATLNSSAVIASTGNTNTVNVEYSNNPDDTTSTGTSTTDTTTTYTYEFQIDKHTTNTAEKLAGAVFQLKDSSNNVIKLTETSAGSTVYYVDANGSETVTTTASGIITIKGLEPGTYTITETAAPTGYNKLAAPITLVIDGTTPNAPTYQIGSAAASTNEVVDVVNTKGTMLPVTGGMGTVGLTVLGVTVIFLGFAFTSRKKKSA